MPLLCNYFFYSLFAKSVYRFCKLRGGIIVKSRYLYDADTVINDVKAALSDMFGGGILGRKVYCAEICDRIYHTAGVESYRLVSPDYDYAAQENVLLRAGEIKVSRW